MTTYTHNKKTRKKTKTRKYTQARKNTKTRKYTQARNYSRIISKKIKDTKDTKNQIPVFPWYANEYNFNLNRIKDIVARRNTELEIYNSNPRQEFPKYKNKFITFNNTGAYYIIKTPWESNLELNYLTDYFSEKCRLSCCFGNSPSALDYWKKNYKTIQYQLIRKNKPINNYNVKEELYTISRPRTLFCNNFRITLCLEVLELFKPSKWLDISAGWGDRLISALLSSHIKYYCGVDPNPCLHPTYQSIIKHLDPEQHKICKLIQDGFETAILPDIKFDLVFSSPPYFNLEIYSQETKDSVSKYANVNAWFSGFLMPSIKKSIKYLKTGGYLVLYIAEAHNEIKYIPKMILETDKLAKNAGRFYYTNGQRIREFYCWQKK